MSKKNKNLQQAGITLIALVVTIIILLILAGVTISLVLGQNGLIDRAQSAYDTQTKGVIEQEIQQAKAVATIDKTNPTTSEGRTWLQIVRDYLSADTVLTGIGETTAVISKNFILLTVNQQPTGIQYNYKITEEELEFISDADAAADLLLPELVDLESGELAFAYSEENPTNQNITVTVTINKQIEEGLSLAYKIGTDGAWQIYTAPIEVSENCNIYFTLYNGKNYGDPSSNVANITNIDKNAPTSVSFTAGTQTSKSVTLQATATDEGESGTAGVKYFQYSTDGGTTWSANQAVTVVAPGPTNKEITINGLTAETTYQIKIKVIDQAGNEAESTTQSITTAEGPKTAEVLDSNNQPINLASITTSDYGNTVTYNGKQYQIFYNDTTGKYSGGTAGVWLLFAGYLTYSKTLNESQVSTAGISGNTEIDKNSVLWQVNPDLVQYKSQIISVQQNNIKGVAYLCDTSKWCTNYVKAEDKKNGAYAIGGVSVEMFCESYNQVKPSTYPNFIAKAFDTNSTYGYYYSPYSTNQNQTITYEGKSYARMTNRKYEILADTGQGMYKKSMWYASPSAYDTEHVCFMPSSAGVLSSEDVNNSYKIYPAVFLPFVTQ